MKDSISGILTLLFGFLILFLGFHFSTYPKKEIKVDENLIEDIKKTTSGDLLILRDGNIGKIERGGEDAIFSTPNKSPRYELYSAFDFKESIEKVVFKSDTLEWYDVAVKVLKN